MDVRFAKMTMHVIAAMPFGKGSVRLSDFLLGAEDNAGAALEPTAADFDAAAKGQIRHG